MHRPPRLLARAALLLLLVLIPSVCLAAPAGPPLVGFGQRILDFLTGPLAFIVTGIGIAVTGISLLFGSRDGLAKGIYALIGGGLLFGARAVATWIQGIS